MDDGLVAMNHTQVGKKTADRLVVPFEPQAVIAVPQPWGDGWSKVKRAPPSRIRFSPVRSHTSAGYSPCPQRNAPTRQINNDCAQQSGGIESIDALCSDALCGPSGRGRSETAAGRQ